MSRFRRAESRPLFQSSWLTLSQHRVLASEGELHPHPVYTLDMGDWVNIVALTKSDEVVFVRQHRFGTQADSLEIPGGLVDPGESPLDAARRELAEETGYSSDAWEALSWTHPNPALQANKLFMYVARGCEKTHEIELDPLEDCRVELIARADLPLLLKGGAIRHALVLVALYEVLLADRGLDITAP